MSRKKLFFIITILALEFTTHAQVTFEKVYGGSGDDIGNDIKQAYYKTLGLQIQSKHIQPLTVFSDTKKLSKFIITN